MKRRILLQSGAALLAWPALAYGQTARRAQSPRRVGFLITGLQTASGEWTAGGTRGRFIAGMRELGYVEGRDYELVERLWRDRPERAAELANELVHSKVEIIVAVGPESVEGARKATRNVPIVMLFSTDPVRVGWVSSLKRPGGNLTGVAWDGGVEFALKQVELLKEVLPDVRRIAVLGSVANPGVTAVVDFLERESPQRLGVSILRAQVAGPSEFKDAFTRMQASSTDALIVITDPLTVPHRAELMAHARRGRLPTLVTADLGFPDALLVFGPNIPDMPRRAASYVDRILKGARPGDLPIEEPTKYELIVDMKTARALGITIPHSVLLRADRVIE